MNLNALKPLLPFPFEYFETIDSTNLYLSRCIKEKKNPPTLLIASEQTNGQGRIGKSFFSPKNTGLYLTFCFPEGKINSTDLTARLAISVCKAIFDTFSLSCGIKWVNDLYLQGRKVCGVLCQKVDSYFLFGIGINLSKPDFVPSEIEHRFGSLFESCDPDQIPLLIENLYRCLLQALAEDKKQILAEYRARLVHLDRSVTIIQNNVPVCGICTGISDDFELLLKTEEGIRSFSSGYMIIN